MRWSLLFIVFFAPISALAQPVTVRAGEHGDFTRFVFTLPPDANWVVRDTGEQTLIRIDGADEADLEGAFNRINRARVRDMSASVSDPITIALDLACNCESNAFPFQNNKLVIDISAAAPAAFTQVDLPLITEKSADLSPRMSIPLAPFSDIIEAETRLAAILDIVVNPPLPLAAPVSVPEEMVALNNAPGVRVITGDSDAGETIVAQDLLRCPPPDHFDIPSWGDPEVPFTEQLTVARGRISLERDRTDVDAVTALARLYVYFGFGREAIDTLTIDGSLSAERNAILQLAYHMDDMPRVDIDAVDQVLCPPPVSLWALLATPVGEVPEDIDADGIARALKLLPPHLQRHLGPAVADRIGAAGRIDVAETALAPSRNPDGLTPPDVVLAAATIEESLDRPLDAEARLSDLVETETDVTPETVTRLTNLQIQQGLPVPEDRIALIDSLIFEWPQDAASLRRLRIEALIHRGSFAEAALSLPDVDTQTAKELGDDLLAAATVRADAVTFLNLAFSDLPNDAAIEVQNRLARRLIDGGFGERATDLLARDGSREAMAERRYLRAEAAVATGDGLLAERHLAGITTPRAEAILAQARFGLLDQDSPLAADWRAGNWGALATSDDALLQSASSALLAEPTALDLAAAPLRDGAALLDGAATTRSTVEALLNRFPIDDEEE